MRHALDIPHAPGRTLLRRHRLARPTTAGWHVVLGQSWDAQARACLAHWASHGLPLVVTRQAADVAVDGAVALGLSAPLRWDRRRLALRVPHAAIDAFDEFPPLAELAGATGDAASLHAPTRAVARDVVAALDVHRATARVFGSHGWQAITGLDHVRPTSDLDLWIAVDDVAHADAVAQALAGFGAAQPRLDGELVFGDGTAVAWREWIEWRAGRARAVLVRHLDGVSLRRDTAWCATSTSASLPRSSLPSSLSPLRPSPARQP